MDERTKTINYIESLKATIPEALLKDNKELADAEEYLAKLDAEIAKKEAAEKKKLDAEKKAKAKRLEKNKTQLESLQSEAFKLREKVLATQSEVEPEYKRVFGDLRLGLTQAVGRFVPSK